ncbi:hypothetical protein LCGC14_3109490 [marine sediment metagenome]|uniref:HD domain-containing protein n=1 Tax=marine sediment metagenome TaxID=412755 RepID=A0A0F8YCX7_9ZZZZ
MNVHIKEPHILTYSGLNFLLYGEDIDAFRLEDIAHSLSMQCRYTGHTKQFYSVAEHCILMSRYVTDLDCKVMALYHDAVETYIGDIASPVKRSLPDYRKLEDAIERRLFMWLGYSIPSRVKKLIKILDTRIMLQERNELLPAINEQWIENEVVTPLDVDIMCWNPARAEKEYLKQAEQIRQLVTKRKGPLL